MAHPIENTLALLQDAMIAHQQALARGPSTEPSQPVAEPRDLRAQLVLRLLTGVEMRAGIEVSQPAAEKLLRLLAAIDIGELEAWAAKLDTLPASHPEWLSLIESLTVHETYVMRDPSQLAFFAAQLPALIAEAAASKFYLLRFWSVGCATGEEAYSIAALTLDAMVASGNAVVTETGANLVAPWQIEIVGSDISRLALTQAQAGIYDTGPLSSFRDESEPTLRHFPSVPAIGANSVARRSASPDLKATVSFSHFNIIDDPMPAEPFDTVFCRNVLIYFSARARKHAQETLRRAVRPGGYLLLGPTDTLIETEAFEALWAPGAVIYRRRKDDA
ncbi:CheR family methyltransferase [Methyloferula stellata]|uniref:CheR family methyltransferase n=1 Tax=Methyloferula stellata TaxID=876270 RepID=UPI000370C21F|nr:protein-glutamate O-methyltransferase CheR [Methyloferula stellata]